MNLRSMAGVGLLGLALAVPATAEAQHSRHGRQSDRHGSYDRGGRSDRGDRHGRYDRGGRHDRGDRGHAVSRGDRTYRSHGRDHGRYDRHRPAYSHSRYVYRPHYRTYYRPYYSWSTPYSYDSYYYDDCYYYGDCYYTPQPRVRWHYHGRVRCSRPHVGVHLRF